MIIVDISKGVALHKFLEKRLRFHHWIHNVGLCIRLRDMYK